MPKNVAWHQPTPEASPPPFQGLKAFQKLQDATPQTWLQLGSDFQHVIQAELPETAAAGAEAEVEEADAVEAPEPEAPRERMPPVESRFLYVDVAARRAKQLRRGALPRLAALVRRRASSSSASRWRRSTKG